MKNNKSYYCKVVVKPDLKHATQDLNFSVPVKHIDRAGETTILITCDLSGWTPCTSSKCSNLNTVIIVVNNYQILQMVVNTLWYLNLAVVRTCIKV